MKNDGTAFALYVSIKLNRHNSKNSRLPIFSISYREVSKYTVEE